MRCLSEGAESLLAEEAWFLSSIFWSCCVSHFIDQAGYHIILGLLGLEGKLADVKGFVCLY